MDSAAANGHVRVLMFLHAHYRSVGCTAWGVECAAGNGHYSIVAWLAEHELLQCYEAKFALLRAAGTHQRLHNVFFAVLALLKCSLSLLKQHMKYRVAVYCDLTAIYLLYAP
jgi:hypothetical protein